MYTDAEGNSKVTPLDTYMIDEVEVFYYPATQEDIKTIKQLIEGIKITKTENRNISVILQEEAEAYFSGQKSAEEVAEIVENRIRTYIAENYN
jgi:hypothetical protein